METRDWLLTISMIGHFGHTLWAYVDRKGDKTNARLADLERAVSEIKSAAASAPTHADLGAVYEALRELANTTNKSIGELAGTVHQLVGENRGQTDTLRLILHRLTGGQ